MSPSRRSALAGAGAVVVGGVAGFLVARTSAAANAPNGTTAANAYGVSPLKGSTSAGAAPLVAVANLPDHGGEILADPPVVVTRTGDTIRAFSAICTHQGCRVDRVSGGRIYCPCHASVFDAATGHVLAGPAPRALPAVAVSVRGGEVYRA